MAAKDSRKKVAPIPPGFRTITPHLVVRNVAAAIDFYQAAFGAEVLASIAPSDNGAACYARLKIENSLITLSDEQPEAGLIAPIYPHAGGVTLHLYVKDVDLWWSTCLEAGASVDTPLFETYWGDRLGVVIDPFGHRWSLASRKTRLSDKEIAERAKVMLQPVQDDAQLVDGLQPEDV